MRKLIMLVSLISVFSAILPDSFVVAEQEKSPSIWQYRCQNKSMKR
jgi:hypothetical protein